jgi:hypothetical protein
MVMKKRDAYLDDEIIPDGGSVRVPMLLFDSRRFSAANHQRGYRFADGQSSRRALEARDAYVRKLQTAWMDARRKPPDDDDDNDDNDEQDNNDRRSRRRGASDASMVARDAYVRKLQSAWKTLGRDKNPGGGLTCPRCHGSGEDPKRGGVCPRCDGEGYIEDYPQGKQWEPKDRGAPDPGVASSRPWQGNEPDNSSSPETMRVYLQGKRDQAYARYCDNLSNAWKQGTTDPTAATRIENERERYLGKFE